MIVFHGTMDCCVSSILKEGPHLHTRLYLHSIRKAFSTTLDFSVAALFAMRNTQADLAIKGIITGQVIEFQLIGKKNKDYIRIQNPRCIQNEKEIAVFQTAKLKPVAIWSWIDHQWVRAKL